MGSKGLKAAVAEAMAETKPPVNVSAEALRSLTATVQQWTGRKDTRLMLAKPPSKSPHAAWNNKANALYANVDSLLLNPHRVLLTVTPFRLRQEAVLTGAMLHEAGHARHSHWMLAPTNVTAHSDGAPLTMQVRALAELMEEARIEGLMARDADKIGAPGLGWTMRASSAALLPTTKMHLTDPGQRVMDMNTSWALRAGRQIALAHHTNYNLPRWVGDYNSLLHQVLVTHLTLLPSTGEDSDLDPTSESQRVISLLLEMCACTDDRGPEMIDLAREVLRTLFPETDGDSADAPMPGDPHEEQEDEEDQPEDTDDQSEEDESEGETPEQDEDGDEAQPGDDEPGDEPGEGQDDESDSDESDDSDGDDGDDEGDPSETDDDADDADSGDDSDEDGDDDGDNGDSDTDSDGDGDDEDSDGEPGATSSTEPDPVAEALAELEAMAAAQGEEEADELADEAPSAGAGAGSEAGSNGGWRNPDKMEREVGNDAGRFMRTLIDPTEVSKRSLNDTPSSSIDGAAHAAWKAGGMRRDPAFFVRTQRQVMPSPPVKIAILVDVSASMDELQAPSALLSWALAAAAIDLRNFAGRGQQIESTLIHWGNTARVIQGNGQPLPGIREFDCDEGTSAMDQALALVEQQIPGFFDAPSTPVNRLLVQFTDWELWRRTNVTPWIKQGLETGVNMLSVVPKAYGPRYSVLDGILKDCPIQRGKHSLIKYNPKEPGAIWREALASLT